MSAFFGGNSDSTASNAGTQAPVVAGTTTREQFAPQTGATTPQQTGGGSSGGGTGSGAAPTQAAPTSAAPTQAAAAPAFNSFSTWLGANQPSGQQEAQKTTGSANSAASAANQATSGFTNYANSSASQGTDTGYVGSASSASPVTQAPATAAPATQSPVTAAPAKSVSGYGPVSTNGTSGGKPLTVANSSPTGGLSSASGGLAASSVGNSQQVQDPAASGATYDLSNVNLQGYGGPSADQQQASAQGQALAAAQAQAAQQSQALQAAQSGSGAQNAWDSALLTSGDGRNAILQALQGANMAGSNAGAAQQGAATAVGNAQAQSNANVAQQKTDLSNAASSQAATASTNSTQDAAITGSLESALSTASPGNIGGIVNQYTPYLESLGFTPQQLSSLENDPAALMAAVQGVTSSGYSGYNDTTAANTNSINSLLGNGAATVSGGTNGQASSTASAAQYQAEQDTQALQYLKSEQAKNAADAKNGAPQAQGAGDANSSNEAISYLLHNGLTPAQLAAELGLTGQDADAFVSQWTLHSNPTLSANSSQTGAAWDSGKANSGSAWS